MGQQLSVIGSMLARFALVWWLTERTGSATVLATATLVSMLPGVLLGPFAGALVDRWNRRIVVVVADGFVALFSAWLAYLFWADALQIWHVYVIMLARAIGGTFHGPAMSASTPLLVPVRHLARVHGLNATVSGAVKVAAPPLGALLVGFLPLHGIMAIDVISAAFAIVPLFFVSIPQPTRAGAAGAKTPSVWADVREGLRYVWNWPGLRAGLVLAAVINLTVTPAFSLLPILVTRHFGHQATHLGWMNSAAGIGMVLGGLVLSAWGGFRRRIVTTLLGTIGLGIGTLLIGVSPANAFWMALGAMVLVGVMGPLSDGPIAALFQSVVPADMQGRVFTVLGSVSMAMTPLGMAIAGPLADRMGVHTWFILSGVACVSMAIYGLLNPVVMHMEENHSQGRAVAEHASMPTRAQASVGAE
jgi:DHA3 family macrolide efflux protein-like MFS transporter